MSGYNKVILLGNLGADPELRMTQGGRACLNMRLATNETYTDRNNVKQERTEWHTVTMWGPRAEALAKILSKGSSILVEGSLRSRSFQDRDGNKRWVTEIDAKNIELVGSRRELPSEVYSDGGDDGDPPF